MRPAVAIVGSGRTGTHWLGGSLDSSGFALLGEGRPGFECSVVVALGWSTPKSLIRSYRVPLGWVGSKPLAFKWHPSLWSADELMEAIPHLKIIGTKRRILDTAISMNAHPGTRRWLVEHERYPSNPRSDGFLGRMDRELFDDASIAGRCAMRAASHYLEVCRLQERYPDRVLGFDYDAAVRDPEFISDALSTFLDHEVKLDAPVTRQHDPLTESELAEIDEIVARVMKR